MSVILIVLAVVVVGSFLLVGPRGSGSGFSNLDKPTLDRLKSEGKVQYIDVRTPGEFSANSIKGFKNIPLQSLSTRLKEIDTEKPVILMCASGMRSQQAASLLVKAGYKSVYNVKGGIAQWLG